MSGGWGEGRLREDTCQHSGREEKGVSRRKDGVGRAAGKRVKTVRLKSLGNTAAKPTALCANITTWYVFTT